MFSIENINHYFKGNLKNIQKEAIDTISYLYEQNCSLKKLPCKLSKLNYYENKIGKYNFTTSSGIRYNIDLRDGGGNFTPLIAKNSPIINDYLIYIEKKYAKFPEYKVHELLHFLSTQDLEGTNLRLSNVKSGIIYLSPKDINDSGLLAINEAITDFFAFRICAKKYNRKYYKLYNNFPEENPYYYPILLINLLVFASGYKKNNLLKAYINNDTNYVFNEIKLKFGLNKNEAKALFAEASDYFYSRKEFKKQLQKDIKKVVKFYYDNQSQKFKNEYPNFEKIYLSKFKSLYK